MPWLKYEMCYASGFGEPEFVRFNDGENLEDLKTEIYNEHGDGMRVPRWTILADNELPEKVLEGKINELERLIAGCTSELAKLRENMSFIKYLKK